MEPQVGEQCGGPDQGPTLKSVPWSLVGCSHNPRLGWLEKGTAYPYLTGL